jgi:hypothetical protein
MQVAVKAIGLDIAKSVFQLHGVVCNLRFMRRILRCGSVSRPPIRPLSGSGGHESRRDIPSRVDRHDRSSGGGGEPGMATFKALITVQ